MLLFNEFLFSQFQKIVKLNCAIILHGSSGEGKTTTASKVAEEARKLGLNVKGILCRRLFSGASLQGFDVINLETGESSIFARLRTEVSGPEWLINEPLIYAFLKMSLHDTNNILVNAAKNIDKKTLIIIDEYGRLESKGLGIFQGFKAVINADSKVGTVLIICRTDKVEEVSQILKEKTNRLFIYRSGDFESIIRILTEYIES